MTDLVWGGLDGDQRVRAPGDCHASTVKVRQGWNCELFTVNCELIGRVKGPPWG